jgi:hypothetical protein
MGSLQILQQAAQQAPQHDDGWKKQQLHKECLTVQETTHQKREEHKDLIEKTTKKPRGASTSRICL